MSDQDTIKTITPLAPSHQQTPPKMSKPGEKSANLVELGRRLLEDGPVKTLHTPRRVRILFNGEWVADTTSAILVWEHPYYPYYYVPRRDFAEGCLSPLLPSGGVTPAGFEILQLKVRGRTTNRVLGFTTGQEASREGNNDNEWIVKQGEDGKEVLCDGVRVEFGAADAWFEEDMPIIVHPKDPFRRVDVVHATTRSVGVFVGGVEVARAASSYHLYETGLPRRFYLPPTSIADWTLLRASETRTMCPYKGEAEYYDVVLPVEKKKGGGEEKEVVYKDLVWFYRTPTIECAMIAGCLCFYNEKVDIELDGKLLARPKTHFV